MIPKIIIVLCLLFVLMAALLPSSRVDASFLQTGVTATVSQLSIKAPAWNYVCTSSVGYQQWCAMVKDLTALNNPDVDVVLGKYIDHLVDVNGIQIFPRP